jgi:hypothetical protein
VRARDSARPPGRGVTPNVKGVTPSPRLPNSVLARAAAGGAPAAALQRPQLLRQVLARKPAPPSLDALMATVKKAPVAGKGQRAALIKAWMTQMGKLIDEAKGSGGAHEEAVLANERDELAGHKKHLEEAAANLKGGEDFRDAVVKLTQTKAKELGIELTHDVVVKAGSAGWFSDDIGHIGDALTGMPAGWNPESGKAITFAEIVDSTDDTGGETEVDNTITMHRRGMRSKDYKDDCPALKGLSTHQHSIRHEIGHTVHNRMRSKADELFTKLDWKEYAPANALHRADLAKEAGVAEDKLDGWIAGLGTTRTKKGSRTFMKAKSGLVHSFGKPDELPAGHEWDYAYWSQSEYFAEVYSYFVDRPAFVAGALKKSQLDWWKDNVFGGTLPAAS